MKIEKLHLGFMGTNCYILYDGNMAAIVDPACSPEKIIAKINDLGVGVEYIIITHAHSDHISALDRIKAEYDAKVYIGEDDADSLSDDELSLSTFFRKHAPKTKPDKLIKDGDELILGNTRLNFIHTPGHTKGGICIYTPGYLISGDTLFFESVGRCDFPGGSSKELSASIKNKLFTLPDNTAVYPGHGEPTSIGHEKTNNPYIW